LLIKSIKYLFVLAVSTFRHLVSFFKTMEHSISYNIGLAKKREIALSATLYIGLFAAT